MQRMPLLSAEAINYQNTTVFKELELAFRDIMFQTRDAYNANKRQNEQLIEAIVQNAFKANCSVSFGGHYPCMRIFDEYHNSSLIRNDYRQYYAAQLNFVQRFIGGSRTAIKAGVNINTAQLSGLFSELPFTVYLPDAHLQNNYRSEDGGGSVPARMRFTSDEMAAMMLHEIGHFFTYCEYFNRTVTTNQALTQLSKELDGCFSVSQREVLIARCAADLNLKDVDAAALATTNKKTIIETAIVTESVEKSRSELGISVYDHTSSEFLADQFAARHGASRSLLTALSKFEMLFGSSWSSMSTPVFMFVQLLTIALSLIPPVAFFMAPINLLIIFCGGLGDDGDNTYDTPEMRFRRVRADSINRLKNRYISKEEKTATLADVAAMDEMLTKLNDKREWREYIATTLIPTYRRYRKTKMLQQQLEQLANNPLFVRAAELSVL